MKNLDLIITIIQISGLGVFIYLLIRGLYKKIEALNGVIHIQKQTLETMDKRIQETEKVGLIYKKLIEDLPNDLENYKTIISKTKDEVIIELKNQKDATEKKLKIAEEKINNLGETEIITVKYLKAAKTILEKYNFIESKKENFDLKMYCEYSKYDFEECIKLLFHSNTVEEFITKIGFKLNVYVKNIVMNKITNLLNEFTTIEEEIWSCGISEYAGWFLTTENEIYLNTVRFNRLQNEFMILKQL